ncbi:MAG: aspartate kinase [Planctomycetes bacterium]|nr:aspartate kinase [Planctomycetota bacterium]
MSIVVQKFGGSSLADPPQIRRCARRAVAARDRGHEVVVVVSAMGDTTDSLVRLASQVIEKPSRREMDMLLATGEQVSIALMTMALHRLGADAVSMIAAQIGIITDEIHTQARIRSIDARCLREELDGGRIVVVAGFQGMSSDGQVTTLGRGGSDTTAVAIAAALGVGAEGGACEIYTDVAGVHTADPKYVPNARKLARISYAEMLELASLGAGVLHPRAVMFGQKYSVPIHIRSSAKADQGTMIVKENAAMEKVTVVGCALKADLDRISIRGVPNSPGTQAIVFGAIADANVLVDDIMQTQTTSGSANISFTVEHQDLAEVKPAVQRALDQLGCGEIAVEVGVAKVSAVGLGMRTHSGVAATMFKALGDAGIDIKNITTSEIKVSCIVPKEDGRRAVQAVHDAFGLHTPPATESATPSV